MLAINYNLFIDCPYNVFFSYSLNYVLLLFIYKFINKIFFENMKLKSEEFDRDIFVIKILAKYK